MNERDYEHLAHYLNHPPPTVIADWGEFVRPLPEAPEPRPEPVDGRDQVESWIERHVGFVQRLVLARTAVLQWLPAWETFAATGIDSEAQRLAPGQALWLLDRWLRGDEEQRSRVIRDLQRVQELCEAAFDASQPHAPVYGPAARAASACEWLSDPSWLCTTSESFPFCFEASRAAVVLNMRWWGTSPDSADTETEAGLDWWWRRVCATLAFVDGLSAELE